MEDFYLHHRVVFVEALSEAFWLQKAAPKHKEVTYRCSNSVAFHKTCMKVWNFHAIELRRGSLAELFFIHFFLFPKEEQKLAQKIAWSAVVSILASQGNWSNTVKDDLAI